ALRERPGNQGRDRRASRMPHQREAVPAELIGHVDRVADVLPQKVSGIARAEVASAVAGQVERDHAAAAEERRQPLEASGVVEPAVQCEHGQPVRAPPFERREGEARSLESPLERHASEAGTSPALLLLERSGREALADELLQAFLLLEQTRARQEQHAIAGLEPGDDLAVLEIRDPG